MKKLITWFAVFATLTAAYAKPIQHRFLVFDEAGHQLVHVDEKRPSKNWTLKIDGRAWDLQLVGDNQVALATPNGYHLVDLKSGTIRETVRIDGLQGNWSLHRKPDGTAVAIGAGKDMMFAAEIGQDNQVLRRAEVTGIRNLRFGRVTEEGHALAVPEDELVEWDLDGKIIARFKLPYEKLRAHHLNSFMGLKDADGTYWVSYGYNPELVHLDAEGKLLQTFTGPEGSHFFAGFQRLRNGNMVQANWAGHNTKDAVKGKQLIEFNPQGEVVWTYHNPDLFSCPVSVIILDHLNTRRPAGDADSILKNFK